VFMQAITITLAYGLIVGWCWRLAGNARWAIVATLLAAAIGYGNWNVRPQTFSILLFVVFLIILMRYRHGHWMGIWLLPFLMALWVNLHGAFVLGFALTVLVLIGETIKRLICWRAAVLSWRAIGLLFAVAALLPLAILINPQGTLIYVYLQNYFAPYQNLIVEWMSTDIRTLLGMMYFGIAALVALVFLLHRKHTQSRPHPKVSGIDPTDILVYSVFFCLGVSAIRNQIWFGLVITPLIAANARGLHLSSPMHPGRILESRPRTRTPSPASSHPWINAFFAGLIILGMLVSLPWVKIYLPLTNAKRSVLSPSTPVAAVAFLQAQGWSYPVFNYASYGSYLTWNYPYTRLVFGDARTELYPAYVWADYFAITRARYDWEDLLNAWGIDLLMLDRAGQPLLIEAVEASSNWERRYEDETTIVFGRVSERAP